MPEAALDSTRQHVTVKLSDCFLSGRQIVKVVVYLTKRLLGESEKALQVQVAW